MIFRQLTDAGDWTFGKGVSGYATQEKAVELNIRTRLLSWKNDCFYSLDDFVDWQARLDRGQEAGLVSEIRSVVLQSFGVVAINDLQATLDRQARKVAVVLDILTIYSRSFVSRLQLSIGGS